MAKSSNTTRASYPSSTAVDFNDIVEDNSRLSGINAAGEYDDRNDKIILREGSTALLRSALAKAAA